MSERAMLYRDHLGEFEKLYAEDIKRYLRWLIDNRSWAGESPAAK